MRLGLLLVALVAAGCAAAPPAPEVKGAAGEVPGRPPVIEAAWAPETGRQYTRWHVYLKVSDPDCDLAAIYASVSQLGFGGYPLQQINLPGKKRCTASGQLSLLLGPEYLWGSRLTVEVWGQDAAGRASPKHTFQVVVDGPAETQPPPEFRGPEYARSLGTINVHLRSPIFDRGRPGLGGRPF